MIPTPDSLIGRWGYLGIIVFLILTGCGLPIPEEVPIVMAGFWSSPADGRLNPWFAMISCFVGAVLGDVVMYGIGRKFGRQLLQKKAWFAHLLTPEKEHQIEDMFRKHGLKVLFVSRFLVGVRSPIYVTAGILKVPFRRFVLVDMFCAACMVGSFFALAYFFSDKVLAWIRNAEVAATVAVVAIAIGAFVAYRIVRKRKRAAAEAAERAATDQESRHVEKSVA